MIKRLMPSMVLSLVSIAIMMPLPAFSQGSDTKPSLTRQQMLDSLVGHEAPSGVGATRSPKFGATRSMIIGGPAKSPSPKKRAQKQFMRSFLQKSQTRSPALPGPQRLEKNLMDTQGSGATVKHGGSTTAGERQQLTEIIKQNKLPAIDLEIYFDYNSAQISPRSIPDLVKLGQVLLNPKLAGSTFLLAGHTDAKGGAQYNLSLSDRRARSVQEFLRASFGIKPDTLVPVGYGEEQLKDRANPFAAQNRRVQIVNLAKMQ